MVIRHTASRRAPGERRRARTQPAGGPRTTTLAAVASLILLPVAAHAAVDDAASEVAPITVIAATPLPGTKMQVAKVPYEVSTLSSDDLDLSGPPSLANGLASRLGSVNVNDDLDDPFQPDILYRGFTASAVLGTPEGLAVYQNGVRINEAFGDSVNWDLIPDNAVARVDVVGSNPVYGLNALGGAVVVSMKNPFDRPGATAGAYGGSFGQRAGDFTYGVHSDHVGWFVAGRALDQDGWRQISSDRLLQLYSDLAWRGDRLSLDLSFTGADNLLHGESPSPVQELAVGRNLIFTSPQFNANTLNFVTLNGTYAASAALSVQGNAYVRDFRQSVANGNTTDYVACGDPALAGLLCQSDAATPLIGTSGRPIADFSNGGSVPIGENNRESLHTLSYGGASQATLTSPILGRPNQLSFGADGEVARTDFASSAEVGVINSSLVVEPSGFIVDTPENTPFTATPARVRADNTSAGAFATDTLDLTNALSITASGRYNWIRIALHDQLGTSLSGTNTYTRFSPAIGLAYRLAPDLTVYGGYAEGSRAPTASEIECSDPQAPCLLPSSLSADPPNLKMVVSHTFEAGVRGSRPLGRGQISYSLGLYRTDVDNDIYAVATSLSAGFFQNISGTRRQGGDLTVTYRDRRLLAYVSYSYVDATFQTDLTLPSPSNPFQDTDGNIHVRIGDHLPGVPKSRLKVGADVEVLKGLRLGGDLQVISGQYYLGDESNQLAPLPGYSILGLHARYAVTKQLSLFVRVENVTDARYATFGVVGDPTGAGAPGVPTNGVGVDPRFQSPAAPISAYGGVKLSF